MLDRRHEPPMRRGRGGLWLPERGLVVPPGYRRRPEGWAWEPPPLIQEAAVVVTTIISTFIASTISSFSIGSQSSSANSVQYLVANSWVNSPPPNTPTVTDSNRTWTQVANQNYAATYQRMTVWQAPIVGSVSGGLTIDYGGQSQEHLLYTWIEVTGVNTTTPTLQSKEGNNGADTTSLTLTFDSSPTSGAVLAIFCNAGAVASTPRASWTELVDTTYGNVGANEVQYRLANDTAASVTVGSATGIAGVAFELNPSAATSYPPARGPRLHFAILAQ